MTSQPILSEVPRSARFVVVGVKNADAVLARLQTLELPDGVVVGIGEPLLAAARRELQGLRSFPLLEGPGGIYPSTQGALWASFAGEDPGTTLHSARKWLAALGPDCAIEDEVCAYRYAEGRDLSGYEDGTENPKGDDAVKTALIRDDAAPGLAGSSFVAVQRWVHDLNSFERMSEAERNAVIGRHRVTNEELSEAPVSAHVKRAAQESYDPPAFMFRRSMPWGDLRQHGLYFVAYGAALDPFERVMKRMIGVEDGIPDSLSRFTRPVSGGYYWCPPMRGNRLDLTALRAVRAG